MKDRSNISEPAAEAPAVDHRKVELNDAVGSPIGVTITLREEMPAEEEPGPDETPEIARLRHLAKSVASWTTLDVDGERYPLSQARAVELFTRFPHFAAQIERAITKDSK